MTPDTASKIPAAKKGDSRLVKILKAIEKAGLLGATDTAIEDATGIWRTPELLELLEMINRWGYIRIVTGNYCRWYHLTNLGKEYLDKRSNEK